jgi:hypothetical protein
MTVVNERMHELAKPRIWDLGLMGRDPTGGRRENGGIAASAVASASTT